MTAAAGARHASREPRALRHLRALVALWLKVAVQYRAELGIWATASLLQAIVYLAVWRAVADASSAGSVGGYDAAAFAGYFFAMLLVRDLTYTWVPWQLPGFIREGTLSPLLLRPTHPLLGVFADVFSFRLQSTLFLVPIGAALFFAFDARIDLTWQGVLAASLVIPLASAVRFLADSVLALASFWLVRIDGIRGVYFLVLLFLGGQFVPVGVLPHELQLVAKCLPFYWALGYPVELLVGRAEPAAAVGGAAVLAGWTLLLWALLTLGWRRGVARYGAVGA